MEGQARYRELCMRHRVSAVLACGLGALASGACAGEGEQRNPEVLGANERQQGEPAGDEGAQPPTNIAGAFLVSPKVGSCLFDARESDASMLSVCGLTFDSKPVSREQNLRLKDLPPPSAIASGSLTLKVFAADADAAARAAQSWYGLSAVRAYESTPGASSALGASARALVRIDDRSMLVYMRSGLRDQASAAPAKVEADLRVLALPAKWASDSKDLEPGLHQPISGKGHPIDSLALQAVFKAGLKVSMAESAVGGTPGITPAVPSSLRFDSLTEHDIIAWLSSAKINFSLILK